MDIITYEDLSDFNQEDLILVERNLINIRVAEIVHKNEELSESLIFIVKKISEIITQEIKEDKIVSYVPIPARVVKTCFKNRNIPNGSLVIYKNKTKK